MAKANPQNPSAPAGPTDTVTEDVNKVEAPATPAEPTPAPAPAPQARKAPSHPWDAHKTEANGLTIYNFQARSE